MIAIRSLGGRLLSALVLAGVGACAASAPDGSEDPPAAATPPSGAGAPVPSAAVVSDGAAPPAGPVDAPAATGGGGDGQSATEGSDARPGAADAVTPATAVTGAEARAAFARLASLAGRWSGRSTAGWEGDVTVEVIARGSVVMSTSHFAAHPGETMVTMYHLHGDELLLTHYCVAGNQPRLRATSRADGGRELTFAYRDGTGLASREEGHMDSVVYRFEDEDSFRSRWTWYQEGSESWMESIRYHRVR